MDNTIIKDYGYAGSNSKLDQILEKMINLEKRQHALESNMTDQIQKSQEIQKYLEENREKYITSLENLSKKEDMMTSLLNQTKNILSENRLLYGQSFDSILQGERQLRDLLEGAKKIMSENQELYASSLKVVCDHDAQNMKNLNELRTLLQNYSLITKKTAK